MTSHKKISTITRRKAIASASSLILASSIAPGLIGTARAQQKTLKILQWNHFVPAFDEWFNETFVKEWGQQNNTRVVVDNVGMTSIKGRAASEIAKRSGHDICMFLSPPAAYEDNAIDHREIYEECARRYGNPLDLAIKSTLNPKTGKYFGFSNSYVPDPVNYRKDLWDDIGMVPDTWDRIMEGGRKIKKKHGIPVGLGLSPELDSNMFLRSIMAAFGASVQNADSSLALKSKHTLEAIKFVKALFRETMDDDVFTWDASSNNRFMLAGRGSLTLNAISITRTGETQKIPMADQIYLLRPAKGPVTDLGLMHFMNAYVIWNFAENIDGAKTFLVDLVGQSRKGFLASKFYNMPV
ncbi:MAG: extracellular solute-binding protein [Proteobacteria bacterium]|nr:extracellular solute-binding protein [Pseudomonadota bacterium]